MFEFSMILAETNRSKAYIQNLIQNNYYPNYVILLEDIKMHLPEQKNMNFGARALDNVNVQFDTNKPLLTTIREANLNFEIVSTTDVNSDEVYQAVKNISTQNIIFSGPSGGILRERILSLNRKYIHVHPGILPDYRGSTTIYYSLLMENRIGCSVIELNDEIDSGRVLYEKNYNIGDEVYDFDMIIDPIIRTDALLDFMRFYSEGKVINKEKINSRGDTFYIIHPVLKHIAIMKQRNIPIEGDKFEDIL